MKKTDAEVIKEFSKRLVEYQRPIRILDAVKWTDRVKDQFFQRKCCELPDVSTDWYQSYPLGFDAPVVEGQFASLKNDVDSALGSDHPAGAVLQRMCKEYILVVKMLAARGTPEFSNLSRILYGATDERLLPGEPTISQFGRRVQEALQKIEPCLGALSKGTPSATVTQEGLAVLMEILALVSSPARQKRINNRIIALYLAENGADFLEVFRYFTDQGISELDSYQFSTRVFRGSVPNGKPFTKDIAYTKGFIQVYNFLKAAISQGNFDLIPLIFCGKTVLSDIHNLQELHTKGLLSPPQFVPPQFSDLHGLAAWFCYEGILSSFNCESLQCEYSEMMK